MRVLWSHKLQQRCEIYSDLLSALPEDCILCVSKAQTSRWISEHADTSKQAFLRLELSFSAVCVRVKFENEFGYFWQEACLEKTFHVHPSSGYIYSHILYIPIYSPVRFFLVYRLPRCFSSSALWLPIRSSLHMLLDDTILFQLEENMKLRYLLHMFQWILSQSYHLDTC